MLRSTTISIRSAISSLAKLTNKGELARWPSGAPSRPNGRLDPGVLCHCAVDPAVTLTKPSHDVALKRDVDAELEFDNEAVEARIDRRMRERIDRPNRPTRLLGETKLDQRRRKPMVPDGEMHGLAKVHAAEDGEAVHAV